MSLILESKMGGDFKPHVEGIHPAVCVDVIDLGLVESEWQGQRRLVNKARLVFESEQRGEDGRNSIITKTFTASLHPKAKLAEFLGKWRGRPVVPGETIDLSKLIGACCTLVISHQQNMVGRTYASIDAVSKPTRKVTPSGHYDPAMARQRIAEAKAKEAGSPRSEVGGQRSGQSGGLGTATPYQQQGGGPRTEDGGRPLPKSGAPSTAPEPEVDPEVGF